MEPRECKITFIYPKKGYEGCYESVEYQIRKVNYKEPYKYSKWLFTQLINAWPYLSLEAKDDEELFILFAKQSINAVEIYIEYYNETENTINT